MIHPEITDMVNHAAKLPAQEALSFSGLDDTVLLPAVFMPGWVNATGMKWLPQVDCRCRTR